MNQIDYERQLSQYALKVHPNFITFNHWILLKNSTDLTYGYKNFKKEEIDQIGVYYDANGNYLDWIKIKEVEDRLPTFVLLPKNFWKEHLEQFSLVVLDELKIPERMAEMESNKEYRYNKLRNSDSPFECNVKLREEQIPLIEEIKKEQSIKKVSTGVVIAAPGFGKEQPNSFIIPLANGKLTTMGELTPGQKVIDCHGNPTTVLGVFPQGRKKKYKMSFEDGSSVICGKEHLWTVIKYRTESTEVITETTETLMNAYVSKEYTYAVKLTKPIKYTTSPKLKISPYALGLLLTGGTLLDNKILYSNKESTLIDRLLKELKLVDSGLRSFYTKDKNHLVIFSKIILDILKDYNLGNKYNDKFIPSDYLIASREERRSLLQGFIDAYSKDISYHKVSLRTDSSIMIHQLHKLSKSLGIYTDKIKLESEKTNRLIWNFVMDLNQKNNKKIITRIEELDDSEEMTCISVDNKEHLYLTGTDFTITHNTITSIKILQEINATGLIVVPNEVLSDQWQTSITTFTNIKSEEIAVLEGSDLKKLRKVLTGKKIAVIKIASLHSQLKRESIFDLVNFYSDIDCVIYDECHTSGAAEGYAKTTSMFKTDNIIGMSATPYRTGINDYLLRVSIGETLYKSDHKNLIPDIELHNIWLDFSPQEIKKLKSIQHDFIMFLGLFNMFLSNKQPYFDYLADWTAYNKSLGHIVVNLFSTNKMVQKLNDTLKVRHPDFHSKYKVLTLTGTTKKDSLDLVKIERKRIMLEFKEFKENLDQEVKDKKIKRKDTLPLIRKRRKEIDEIIKGLTENSLELYKTKVKEAELIISNYNLLSAGFDKPELSNIIYGSPRIGKVSVIQSLGRVTRIFPNKMQTLAQFMFAELFLDFNPNSAMILRKNIEIEYSGAKYKYIGFKNK